MASAGGGAGHVKAARALKVKPWTETEAQNQGRMPDQEGPEVGVIDQLLSYHDQLRFHIGPFRRGMKPDQGVG